jgi:hypothetical protein
MAHKLIFGYVYAPHESIFKIPANEKAKAFSVYCEASERCYWYAQGACICQVAFSGGCPHGYQRREEGFTRKARGYGDWVRKQREALAGVKGANSPASMLAVVGDYVHLPYSHMTMNTAVPFLRHDAPFRSGCSFIRKEQFTLDVVLSILDFVPRNIWGEKIPSYQKEEVPKFVAHLATQMPEMYEALLAARPALRGRLSNVGRKALLRTLAPNVGTFEDSGNWTWDGTYLTSTDAKMWVGGTRVLVIRVVPDPESVVKVKDDAQVTPETVFLS